MKLNDIFPVFNWNDMRAKATSRILLMPDIWKVPFIPILAFSHTTIDPDLNKVEMRIAHQYVFHVLFFFIFGFVRYEKKPELVQQESSS